VRGQIPVAGEQRIVRAGIDQRDDGVEPNDRRS
jgi:hypothetical protein